MEKHVVEWNLRLIDGLLRSEDMFEEMIEAGAFSVFLQLKLASKSDFCF